MITELLCLAGAGVIWAVLLGRLPRWLRLYFSRLMALLMGVLAAGLIAQGLS